METFSLNITLLLGTSGLPHILIRFFTVKNVSAVKQSIYSAAGILGVFYLMILLIGMGAVAFIPEPLLHRLDANGDLAAPYLAYALGGDFFMAFVTAVAFSTILAVVTGLLLSATSSFAHDMYAHLLKHDNVTDDKQIKMTRIVAAVIGVIAVLLALLLKHANVLSFVTLTFGVAASAHLPVLILSLYWKRFTASGAITGIMTGLFSSLGCVVLAPDVIHIQTKTLLGYPIFLLHNPGIVTIPLGFLSAIVASLMSSKPSEHDAMRFERLCIKRRAVSSVRNMEELTHG